MLSALPFIRCYRQLGDGHRLNLSISQGRGSSCSPARVRRPPFVGPSEPGMYVTWAHVRSHSKKILEKISGLRFCQPMTPRQKLITRIQALLSKTLANGCTEGEAMSALAKARELMAAHDLSDTDLAFGGEEVTQERREREDRSNMRRWLAPGVAAFCSCRVWRGVLDGIIFCGLQSDAIFAHWLLDMIVDFGERQLADYLKETWHPFVTRRRRRETQGFVIGFCDRLDKRLRELVPESTELVRRKQDLVKAHVDGMAFRRGRSRSVAVDNGAIRAGQAAGDAARFNRPVEGSACPVRFLQNFS